MELQQVYRYVDPYSLLVMTPKKLIRINCPFRVELEYSTPSLSEDDTLMVTKVMMDPDKMLVYIINGMAYTYRIFRIIV